MHDQNTRDLEPLKLSKDCEFCWLCSMALLLYPKNRPPNAAQSWSWKVWESQGHTGGGGELLSAQWRKNQNSNLSVICAVLSLIAAMQATQGVGNTFLGVRSFLTSFLVGYKSAQVVSLPQPKQFIQTEGVSVLHRGQDNVAIPEQVILLKLY